MKKFSIYKKVAYALAVLVAVGSTSVQAAEIWSEPVYTEQWSTDWSMDWSTDWGTMPATKPATQPTIPPETGEWGLPSDLLGGPPLGSSKSDSIYIKLQLNSKKAMVGSEERLIDVPPTTINGRTMVPFRFLADALGANVEWDSAAQKITLALAGKTIELVVNQPTALVNGRRVSLDVPPALVEGRTLVPVRFVTENMDLFVNYTAAAKSIAISDRPVGGADAATSPGTEAGATTTPPSSATDTEVKEQNKDQKKEPITDFEKLYGTWYIWTPGGATNLYYTDTGNYATHEYTMGADQGTVTIRSDGTYAMKHALWGEASGKWRLSYPAEINGERIQAIVLTKGPSGYDWAVAPSENGKIRLLSSWGTWADGSSSWSFDSELYQK